MESKKTLCVAGASGLVGSNIVRALLARGYKVKGTMRDKDFAQKSMYLRALPGGEKLDLFNAKIASTSIRVLVGCNE